MNESPKDQTLPDEILAHPIRGRHLRAPKLGEELGRGETLLVFLRHLG